MGFGDLPIGTALICFDALELGGSNIERWFCEQLRPRGIASKAT